jgi:hypothetical protein
MCQWLSNLTAILVGATIVALSGPASAVTCEEARGLTQQELQYWAGRLEVSPAYLSALLDRAFCAKHIDKRDVLAMHGQVSPEHLAACDFARPSKPAKKGAAAVVSQCALSRQK